MVGCFGGVIMIENYKMTYDNWLKEPALETEVKDALVKMGTREEEVYEAFYKHLEFGTAGLRGIMGPGTNRMNVVVIRRVTQGIANYLKRHAADPSGATLDYAAPAVAISYDSRKNSRLFAETTASVLSANGIHVFIFRQMMPVPALSFVTRHLECQMGIMITASHNAKEYNGFKVYGPDGGQILSAIADEILGEINKVDYFDGPKSMSFEEALLSTCQYIPEEVEDAYLQAVMNLSTGENLSEINLVYTPLNGAGLGPVWTTLSRAGLKQFHVVTEQKNPDGDFPTCPQPNPELPEVYKLAMVLANEVQADLILATDPDSDRVGMAIPDDAWAKSQETPHENSQDGPRAYRVLTGNEIAVLLLDYLIHTKPMPTNPLIIRTIVSTPLVDYLAKMLHGEVKKTLIGFKYIGSILTELEKEGDIDRFLFGFEEGNGFLASAYVRDKDAVGTTLLLCQMAAYHKRLGIPLSKVLARIYQRHGVFREKVMSFEFEGAKGIDTMKAIMERFRDEQREEFLGKKAIKVTDYLEGMTHYLGSSGTSCDMAIGMKPTGLPKENIMKFVYGDYTSFVVRPSGTEPKLKIYLFASGEEVSVVEAELEKLEAQVRKYIEKGE
jgi:phosphoglucomutase